MSDSHNWKKLGAKSGNMYRHRNIKANKLNYETGKWEDIKNADGKKIGIAYSVENSITNEKMLVGIGTKQPFSRLSLGSNTDDGSSSIISGRLAAIAVHEEPDGKDFHGLSYVTDLSSSVQVGLGKTNALALYSNTPDENLNTEGAKFYLTDEGCVTIGGKPRRAFDSWNGEPVTLDNNGVPIKIDCKGSMNVSGFISFMDYNGPDGEQDNPANAGGNIHDPNAFRNIPVGSIWTGFTEGSTGVAMYIQDVDGKREIVGSSSGGGGGGGGVTDISGILWDGSQNDVGDSWVGKSGYNLTLTPSSDVLVIGNNVTRPSILPPNALTVTRGNLSVVGSDNYPSTVVNNIPPEKFNVSSGDNIGGIIWAERQIAIGKKSSTAITPISLLDIAGNIKNIPAITINSSNINSATNSILISSNSNIGNTEGTYTDVSNCFIIGDNTIYGAENSVIIGKSNTTGSNVCDINCGKQVLIIGETNNLTNEINTIVIGKNNAVDSSGNNTDDNGNIIFGENNTYKSKTDDGENNFILGAENYLIDSEYSIITGNSNNVSGKNNLVVGINNKIGDGSDITTTTTTNISNNSYVLGNNNTIKVDGKTVSNTYIYGANNSYDATDSSFTDGFDSTTMIFGDRAKINWTSDVSNQRFVFSTKEKFEDNGSGSNNGHVFTIDKLGNTVIEGDLTVKGNKSIVDLCGNDAAFNNLRVLNDLSGNDASFNNLRVLNDLSGNDASFNEIVIKNTLKTNTLKTNTIQNDSDDHITISNTNSNRDIVFNTKSGATPTEAMRLVANEKEIKIYGGYAGSNGVTIDADGNLKMKGKLTVDGLIDPTGLVLTKQNGNPNSSDSSVNHLTLFFDETSGGLQYVTRNDAGDTETKVIATGSSGGGGGGAAIEGNAETASNLKKGTSRGVLHQTADKVTSILGYGSSNGKYLKSNGSAPTWSDLSLATDSVVGGIKIGYTYSGPDKNYAVRLSGEEKAYVTVPWQDTIYQLPPAESNKLGGIKVGDGLSVTADGTLSASDQSFTLLSATDERLGGIKVGDGLSVTNDGTLSVPRLESITLKKGGDRTITIDAPTSGAGNNLIIKGGTGSSENVGSNGGNLILKGGDSSGVDSNEAGEVQIHSNDLKLYTDDSNGDLQISAVRTESDQWSNLTIHSNMLTITSSLKLKAINK